MSNQEKTNIFKRFFTGNSSDITTFEAPKGKFMSFISSFLKGEVNADVNLAEAENVAAVNTCIKILANTVSKLPKVIKDENGKIIKNDLYKLLNFKPSSYMNRQVYYSTIITQLGYAGNSFVKVNRKNGKIDNLQILPIGYIDEIKIINGKKFYHNKKEDILFRPEEILHFKTNSKDGIWGLNPITALRLEININQKAKQTVNNFYSKNAQSTKTLEYQGGSSDNKKLQEVIDKFNNDFGGVENAGSIITIPPAFKLNELKLSVEDAKFLQSAEFTEKSIAALYGVPVKMLGHSSESYSSYEQEYLAFINNTIASYLSIITTEEEFILAEFEQIEFNTQPLAGTTPKDIAEYFKLLKDMGVLSPEEIRIFLGFDVTDEEYMKYHYQQAQYLPLEKWAESLQALKGVKINDNKEENNK